MCLDSGHVDTAMLCGVDQRENGAIVAVSCGWMRLWSFLQELLALLVKPVPSAKKWSTCVHCETATTAAAEWVGRLA